MKPIVCLPSCGRSGTNLCLEMLAGNSNLYTSTPEEIKDFFKTGTVWGEGYLTKCDCVYYTTEELISTLEKTPNLKLIWNFRDPRDMVLSKIRRGQSYESGGDNVTLADDGTLFGAIKDINDMLAKRKAAMDYDASRNYTVRMEDLILKQKSTLEDICHFLSIPYEGEMVDFVSRMRNLYKNKRYNTLDKSQVGLWEQGYNLYDGFFKTYDEGTHDGDPLRTILFACRNLVEVMDYENSSSIV